MRTAICASFCASLALAQPVFFEIRPDTSTKAEVDLRLGEPTKKLTSDLDALLQVYEYPPPRAAAEADRVAIAYFSDMWRVARIDVKLKAPLAADTLREQFGTRIVVRQREDGRSEELYYPRLQSLIVKGDEASEIGYLSARWLADYYLDRFNEHQAAKRNDEARFASEKAVIIAPTYARGYVAQGIYYWTMKNSAEARVRFVAAAAAAVGERSKSTAHLWLARLHLDEDKSPEEAEAEFRKAIAAAPAFADAHFRYGQFLGRQKRPNDAIAELKRAVELDSTNLDQRRSLADLLGDQHLYADEFTQLKALLPWAESEGDKERVFKARVLRRYAEALWPGRTQAARRAFGKPEDAVEYYEKAARTDPQDPWAFYQIGEIYRERGDPSRAIECFHSGTQRDPKLFELQRSLAMALLEAGRYTEAREVAESSVQLNPKFAAAQMVQVARAWCALRDKKKSLGWLRRAVDGGYNDRRYLTSDSYLAALRDNGDFKKMIERMP